jgi:hypothetical protein
MAKLWKKWVLAAVAAIMVAPPGICGTDHPDHKATAPAAAPEEEATHLDLFSLETDYVGSSRIRELGGRFGRQDALSEHFSYGHRILLSGNWYFRAGLAYDRWDFGGTENGSPLPTHLQGIAGTLAMEYVIHNYAGAALELHPGFYYADRLRGSDSFDMPWDAFASFTIKKDKFYGTLGVSGAQFYEIPVVPIVGVIWLVNDNLRLEAIFPRSSLIYTLNKDWELDAIWEIAGGGFRAGETGDPRLSHSVIEYYENRLGGQVIYSGLKPVKITAGAGWCFERNFNFFRAHEQYTAEGAPYLKVALTADF